MRVKIRLDTQSDAVRLNQVASQYPDKKILLKDDEDFTANAKSIIGVLYSMEFRHIWLESEVDLYSKISDLIIDE